MADIDKDNFIRCHAAIQVLCSNAIPCIQDTLDQWHHGIQTPSCTSPSECPSKKKPTGKNKSCPACVEWGKEIEKAWYVPPSKEPPKPNKAADGNIDKTKKKDNIPWQNVNPTLLGNRNPVESAKAFMNHLLEGEDYKNLGDFDAASILKFMMRFKDFHKEDTNYYELIKEVYDIRNEICHMKINDKLYVDSDTMEDYFKKIIALANGIRIKRPDHFTKDLTSEFNDIKSNPITSNMKRDALNPFSEAKKCAILLNMQEEQRETNQGVKRLEQQQQIIGENTSKILQIVSGETQRGLTRLSLENVEKENNAKDFLEKDFQSMLVQVSNWYDNQDDVLDMLKVLCKDKITSYSDLENAESTMELFELLKRSGQLDDTNCKVLIDAIIVTGTKGVLTVNRHLNDMFCDQFDNQLLTSFSKYRQKLIDFGKTLSNQHLKTLIYLKSVPKRQRNNQWTVILDLEQRGILSEDKLPLFIDDLKKNQMHIAAEKLEDLIKH